MTMTTCTAKTDNPHYVTPEEAKKMGCCMSMNRPEFAAACIGETCMAWCWVLIKYEDEKDPETNSWNPIFSTTHGYCGMVRS